MNYCPFSVTATEDGDIVLTDGRPLTSRAALSDGLGLHRFSVLDEQCVEATTTAVAHKMATAQHTREVKAPILAFISTHWLESSPGVDSTPSILT